MDTFKGCAVAILLCLTVSAGAQAMSSAGTGPMIPEFKSGVAAVEAKDFAAAETHLKSAVEKLPTHADSWSLLGFVSRKLGKVDEAFRYYERALSIDSKSRPALNYLGHLYLETGQIDQARAMLDRLDDACFFGCDEYDDLKKAVAEGKSGKY